MCIGARLACDAGVEAGAWGCHVNQAPDGCAKKADPPGPVSRLVL